MQVHITVSPLGLRKQAKPVKPTISVVEASEDLQIKMLEMSKTNYEEIEPVEAIKKSKEVTLKMKGFIKLILGLTDADVKKISESLTIEELTNYVAYVISRLQGVSEKDAMKALIDSSKAVDSADEADKKSKK